MTQGGGLAYAGIGSEHTQPRLGGQLPKGALESLEAWAFVEEGFALGVSGKRIAGEAEALTNHSSLLVG
jgi:hypothetical protein